MFPSVVVRHRLESLGVSEIRPGNTHHSVMRRTVAAPLRKYRSVKVRQQIPGSYTHCIQQNRQHEWETCPERHVITISCAVFVIADHTVYELRYSYRLLPGIAMVSMTIYLFTVSCWSMILIRDNQLIVPDFDAGSLLLTPVSLLAVRYGEEEEEEILFCHNMAK